MRFFTSDLHLGHARIIELCNRPFSSVNEMNEEIIRRWNMFVTGDDTVYILGDLALGTLNDSLGLVRRLNGEKILVPGNHDRCWSGNKKFIENMSIYTKVGLTVAPEFIVDFGTDWKLCHFPYFVDSQDQDRYEEYRPLQNSDQWLLHGHVHNAWTVKGRQINVGVDVWNFYPVSQDRITQLIQTLS